MRAQALALAVAVLSGVPACSIDVRERGDSRHTRVGTIVASDDSSSAAGDMVIYPRARRVANVQTEPMNVGFSGSFADTRVVHEQFESDDAPAMVIEFYRARMRAHSEAIECRGDISIRRSHRIEKPVCLERLSSPVVQLATGTRSHYRLVAVKPRGTATEFTLLSVDVR
jgi:hypothetical protein